jgi:hypothetical protein
VMDDAEIYYLLPKGQRTSSLVVHILN